MKNMTFREMLRKRKELALEAFYECGILIIQDKQGHRVFELEMPFDEAEDYCSELHIGPPREV
jgi:hypothetical protein